MNYEYEKWFDPKTDEIANIKIFLEGKGVAIAEAPIRGLFNKWRLIVDFSFESTKIQIRDDLCQNNNIAQDDVELPIHEMNLSNLRMRSSQ